MTTKERPENSFDAERRLALTKNEAISAIGISENSFDAERRLAHPTYSDLRQILDTENSFDAERRLAPKARSRERHTLILRIPLMPKGV